MTCAEAKRLLGEPLRKGRHGSLEVWEYSMPNGSQNFHLRQLHFEHGLLALKLEDLHVD